MGSNALQSTGNMMARLSNLAQKQIWRAKVYTVGTFRVSQFCLARINYGNASIRFEIEASGTFEVMTIVGDTPLTQLQS